MTEGDGRETAGSMTTAGFTAREMAVLALITQRLTNDAIARELGISAQTVKGHVRVLLGRTGAVSRRELVLTGGDRVQVLTDKNARRRAEARSRRPPPQVEVRDPDRTHICIRCGRGGGALIYRPASGDYVHRGHAGPLGRRS